MKTANNSEPPAKRWPHARSCQGRATSTIDDWIKNIQTALIGPHCILCRAPATMACALCPDCRADLPWLGPACRYCALELPGRAQRAHCRHCARQPRFDAAVAAFTYEQPVRWLIARLKFNARLSHARLLGDLLANRVAESATDRPQALIPVPLHPRRYRRRGFNQAERIAKRLGRALHMPVARDRVARIRDTHRQSDLPAGQRAANIRNAFICRKPLDYTHVAIVDDVVTTGQTAMALAARLRAAGAHRVDLYCVARA